MRKFVSLGVAILAACTQATPYQTRLNTSYAISPTVPSRVSTRPSCTGCVIQAYSPLLYSFGEADSASWTSVVKTETILTRAISYFTGKPATLQTVTTDVVILNQITTLTGASNEIVTHNTPVFTVTPTPGVEIELPSGTYAFYDKIYGGVDSLSSKIKTSSHSAPYATYNLSAMRLTEPTCAVAVNSLEGLRPSRTEDWRYFFQSITDNSSFIDESTPEPLPYTLLKHLNQDPEIQRAFRGANLTSCTQVTTSLTMSIPVPSSVAASTSAGPALTPGKPTLPPGQPFPSMSPTRTHSTSTYIRTTYQSTSTHITVQGCLRCDISNASPPEPTDKQNIAGGKLNGHSPLPIGPPILSVGDATLEANSQGQFVIGTQTLYLGGPTITVNDYTMSLGWDGNVAVVNGVAQTLKNLQYTTGPAVLAIGDRSISATIVDGMTEFIVEPGKKLLPGSALTYLGTIYSMPADASGSIILINGVTSTLGLGPVTVAPDFTIAGNTYAATIRDGTTEYVLGLGTTLRPGDIVTISGTTYSLDALGTALVINGHTSTVTRIPASNSATSTSTVSQDVRLVETATSASSKGGAISVARGGLDIWFERLIISLASWIVMFL